MLLLDTNIVSELMSPNPNPNVLAWVADQPALDLYLSAVSEAELRYGVEILPAGARRNRLSEVMEDILHEDFAGRILPFDSAAASYAAIAAARRVRGRPISHADCQIAAIARRWGAAVATRNVDDFAGIGVDVINPWVDG